MGIMLQIFLDNYSLILLLRVARSIRKGLGFVSNCNSALTSYLLATFTKPKAGLEILTPLPPLFKEVVNAIMLKNQKLIFVVWLIFLVIWLTRCFFRYYGKATNYALLYLVFTNLHNAIGMMLMLFDQKARTRYWYRTDNANFNVSVGNH